MRFGSKDREMNRHRRDHCHGARERPGVGRARSGNGGVGDVGERERKATVGVVKKEGKSLCCGGAALK